MREMELWKDKVRVLRYLRRRSGLNCLVDPAENPRQDPSLNGEVHVICALIREWTARPRTNDPADEDVNKLKEYL